MASTTHLALAHAGTTWTATYVAVPVVVADLTWGSGRIQTALGAINAVQGVGGALSAGYGGLVKGLIGWTAASWRSTWRGPPPW